MALSGLKKGLFFWALRLGMHYDPGIRGNAWYSFRLAMANRLVFNKWRDALGGNIKVIITGGAALQPRLTRVFKAARIPVIQRSEERRVGKECVRRCCSRWSPCH